MYFSPRLPHVVTRGDLVALLAPTYAKARAVDDEEARERLTRALAVPAALDELYRGLSAALASARGPRTTEDAVVDRISANVAARRSRAKAVEATPAISAVLIRLDLGDRPRAGRDARHPRDPARDRAPRGGAPRGGSPPREGAAAVRSR